MPNVKGKGIARCRELFKVGGVCSSDDDCAGKLKCLGPYRAQKCYMPVKRLPIGSKCDPKSAIFQKKSCVPWLQCLPSSAGYKCQRSVALFEPCIANNTACNSRLATCSKSGSCVPVPVVNRPFDGITG